MPARTALILSVIAAAIVAAPSASYAQAPAAPQSVTPAPLPPGTRADTPGGAARNGVITPPAPGADAAINRGAPSTSVGTPVIPPPGSPGGNPTIVPK